MKDHDSFTVRDLPLPERPRERFQRFGAEALSSQELLALILGRGVSGRSVMTIAQELITRFGSVKAISEATLEELSSIKGIGTAKATQIKAAFELAKRQELEQTFPDYEINSPQIAANIFRTAIGDKTREHFKLLLLNTRNRIIGIVDVSIGTLNASLVHPREVFKKAIKSSASSVIVGHN
jgi:DNA repair protein RadC